MKVIFSRSEAMNKAQFVEAIALDANISKVEARRWTRYVKMKKDR